MQESVLLDIVRAEPLPDGKGFYVEVETNEGKRQLRFTDEDGQRLIAALQRALRKQAPAKIPTKWETSIDPVNQIAVLRARVGDELQEAHIARPQIAAIVEFLRKAL